jgi:putative tricarboxylic transport membrane protein
MAAAAVFATLAAIAMFDTRRGALIGATGDPGGIGSGFYPFWSAAIIGVAGLILLWRQAVSSGDSSPVFASREDAASVVKLVVPMVVAAVSILWLGLYVATALYMTFFARYIGRYRWIWVAVLAIGMPLAIYLGFEIGFRVGLPKSVLYGDVFPV